MIDANHILPEVPRFMQDQMHVHLYRALREDPGHSVSFIFQVKLLVPLRQGRGPGVMAAAELVARAVTGDWRGA
jgi:hypothetical protein